MTKVFLNKGKIEITDVMASFGDTSYPIRNIGAVSIESNGNGAWAGMITCVFVGFLSPSLGWEFGRYVFWGVAALLTISAFIQTHHVTLRTSSGNTHAFSSQNKAEVEEVRLAIVNAIASK